MMKKKRAENADILRGRGPNKRVVEATTSTVA
jgi:hypothetical protein